MTTVDGRLPESAVIAALEAIKPGDTEAAHCLADDILLAAVSPAVRKAWRDAADRCDGWWYA